MPTSFLQLYHLGVDPWRFGRAGRAQREAIFMNQGFIWVVCLMELFVVVSLQSYVYTTIVLVVSLLGNLLEVEVGSTTQSL